MTISTIGLKYKHDNMSVLQLCVKRAFDIVIAIIPLVVCAILWFAMKQKAKMWMDVITGKLSIVGPEPVTDEQLRDIDAIGTEYERVREVTPGLISESRIYLHGSDKLQQRLDADLRYIEHRTLAMEASIILDFLRQCVIHNA